MGPEILYLCITEYPVLGADADTRMYNTIAAIYRRRWETDGIRKKNKNQEERERGGGETQYE